MNKVQRSAAGGKLRRILTVTECMRFLRPFASAVHLRQVAVPAHQGRVVVVRLRPEVSRQSQPVEAAAQAHHSLGGTARRHQAAQQALVREPLWPMARHARDHRASRGCLTALACVGARLLVLQVW